MPLKRAKDKRKKNTNQQDDFINKIQEIYTEDRTTIVKKMQLDYQSMMTEQLYYQSTMTENRILRGREACTMYGLQYQAKIQPKFLKAN